MPWIGREATVAPGLPENLYKFQEKPDGYLAFLGRISPEKRVDRAIQIARRTGMEIKIAAKVDDTDREYFEAVVEPMLKDPLTAYLGEIGHADKAAFLARPPPLP